MAHDISKLPVWAQRHIEVLELNLEREKERNKLIADGDIYAEVASGPQESQPLKGQYPRVRFLFPNQHPRVGYMEVKRTDAGLHIMGVEQLHILPKGGVNVVQIIQRRF